MYSQSLFHSTWRSQTLNLLVKEKAAEPSFTNGTQVEVSLPDKHCCGAWFPATVIKKTKSDSFFVPYNSLRLSVAAGLLRDIVHAKHIRPSPPENFRGIPFYVADKFQHQSNRRAFNQNELRCHIEWINEEMVQQSRVGNEMVDPQLFPRVLLLFSSIEYDKNIDFPG
ncbi:hypothetical protein IFM89_017583 [Coptis chinensis]|uniref:Agenet domain-containing protein n=1 Tax=Coptis chinensis TaxID=261450 RepID=A0A835HUH3_9MAGN|nr:hypothetical protein IFM89_017583 [Coptis chinensis]